MRPMIFMKSYSSVLLLSLNLKFKKMLCRLKSVPVLLLFALILSCNSKPKVKESAATVKDPVVKVSVAKKTADTASIPHVDVITDDLVAFISGMPNKRNGCLPRLDTMVKWKSYSKELDNLFSHTKSFRIEKMRSWSDSELVKNQSITTVFYPFSGPDFLNADIFYPDAEQYILIGQEPIGLLPDLCHMRPDSVKSYLNTINNSLSDIFKRSYFITSRMNKDLTKTKVNGTIPLISLFIKRTGHQIVAIRRVAIDSLGKCQMADSLKGIKNIVSGVKVDFLSLSGKKVQSVYYFRTDISDVGLTKNKGFKAYLAGLPQSFTYLKAASYLMHYETFSMIRTTIFEKSATILQDDSGIAYKYFDKAKWNIKLYGKYTKAIDEFHFISEPDLKKAYQKSVVRPLSYTLGYNWGTGQTNILYAIKNNMISEK